LFGHIHNLVHKLVDVFLFVIVVEVVENFEEFRFGGGLEELGSLKDNGVVGNAGFETWCNFIG